MSDLSPHMKRTLRPGRNRGRLLRSAHAAVVLALAAAGAAATAQTPVNPVYVDDSPAAADALSRALARAAGGDAGEAVRVLQEALEQEGHRVLAAGSDEDLFVTVRRRLHDALLADEALLEQHRETFGPIAESLLEAREYERVERDYFLTPAGAEATLRLARRRLELAQFDAAWRLLAPLRTHPDREAVRPRAAALLRTIARYVDHDAPLEIARDLDAPREPLRRIDPPRLDRGRTPLEPAPPVDLTELVAAPLASAELPSPPADRADDPNRSGRSRRQRGRDTTPPFYVLPTIAGDVVYVNDGDIISAWDRFTLDPIWQTPLGEEQQGGLVQRGLRRLAVEDTNTVAAYGDWVVTIPGVALAGQRDRAAEVAALDATTGARRWTVELASLDPALEEASARGPLMIDQGLVVATLTKQVQQRRLISASLVGLNLGDGSLRWVRPLGSAGSRPYGRSAKVAAIPTLHRGVLYETDELGFIAAVEVVSGRMLWLRRIPTSALTRRGESRPPWAGVSGAVEDGVLYSLSPDGERILALDASTGEILTERESDSFGSPHYLLEAPERLIAVGPNGVAAIRFDAFADESVAPTAIIRRASGDVLGRAVVAGTRILLPTEDGLIAAEADAGDAEQANLLRLEHSGNVAPTPSQLVIVDDESVHSYLMWEVAREVLRDRIDRNPGDPAPAITFAELAYRAGQRDRILEAVDLALAAIERAPLEPRHRRLRERLFESLYDMVAQDDRPATEPLGRTLLADLIDRMGQAAATTVQRVQHLLIEGEFHEEAGEARPAVAAYQAILDSPALASAQVADDAALVRAGDAATAALRRVVSRWGPDPYRPFASEANRRLEQIGDALSPEPYTELARRYPVSAAAARAWLRAAEAHEGRGRPHRAAAALERGLVAAQDALVRDGSLIGELAGRLVVLLRRTGRLEAAAEALAHVEKAYPSIQLTRRGETLAREELAANLETALAARDRRPRLGRIPDDAGMQFLARWRLEPPLLESPSGASTESIALIGPEGLGIWTVASGGGLERRWVRPGGTDAVLLALTTDSAFIVAGQGPETVIERRDLLTGDLRWSLEIESALPDLAPNTDRQGEAVRTPADGPRPADELLVAMDHQTLLLVERSGRAAGVDLRGGRTLWRSASVAGAVHDIDVRSGVLTVAGRTAAGEDEAAQPLLAALESITGRLIVRQDPQVGPLAWVRAGAGGVALAAGAQGVAAVRLDQGQALWRLEGPSWRAPIDAAMVDDHAFLVTRSGEVRHMRLDAGDPSPSRAESRELLRAGRTDWHDALAWRRVGDATLLAAPDGLLLYDRDARLVGADHRAADSPLLAPVVAEDRIVTAASAPSLADGPEQYDLLVFSAESCAMLQRVGVELGAPPAEIAALDSRILVTAGDATVVIDTAASGRGER